MTTRIVLTFDVDPTDPRNNYPDRGNLIASFVRGKVPDDTSVFVEMGTGDFIHGALVFLHADEVQS